MDELNNGEYLVCGDGKTCGFRETFAKALALAAECKNAEIYTPAWRKSSVPGLLQRFWIKVEISVSIGPPANPPLTLDELRGMDGEPVWCEAIGSSTRPDQWCVCHDDYCGNGEWDMFFEDYGETWLAYRHKPEREE